MYVKVITNDNRETVIPKAGTIQVKDEVLYIRGEKDWRFPLVNVILWYQER